MAEVWKGLSGRDRSVIVERLFALSRGVLEWRSQCALGDVSAWAWYGRYGFEVDLLREDLSEAFGKEMTGLEFAEFDRRLEKVGSVEREVVETKLGELGMLFEDWAEACAAGKAVAWIMFGRFYEYVERLWKQFCWEGREDEVEV